MLSWPQCHLLSPPWSEHRACPVNAGVICELWCRKGPLFVCVLDYHHAGIELLAQSSYLEVHLLCGCRTTEHNGPKQAFSWSREAPGSGELCHTLQPGKAESQGCVWGQLIATGMIP